MKLRVLAILLAVAMLFTLAACGGASSPAPASESTPAPASEAAPADDGWDVTRPAGLPEDFPNKEITYIYPFGTGSMQDVYFRVMAEKIKEKEGWKYSMVVKEQKGASGDIGWSAAVAAAPDGYTLGFAPTAQQITAIGNDRPYTFENLAYIFNMMSDPGAVGVAANSKYATLKDLMDAAAAAPGTLSIGVTSVNGSEGLAVIQLQNASGAKFNVVPYDGEIEVLTAVAGGHCDAFCLNIGDCTTFIDEGNVKALAVGTEERSPYYPDVPTYKESGYDVVQVNSRAIAAPKGTDEAIIQYLSDCFMAAAADEDVIAQVADLEIPYDTKNYMDTTAMFQEYYDDYMALWQADPWM